MKKKFFGITTTFLSIALMVSSCSGSNEDDDTGKTDGNEIIINYPTSQVGVNTSAPVLSHNVEQFNKNNKGKIQVVVEEVPGDNNYVEKVKAQMRANQLPDLVYAAGYNILDESLDYVDLVDLTPYLEADQEWKSLFDEGTLKYNTRDGKVYAIPDEGTIIGYFYNKELFEEAGIDKPAETWNELFEQAELLKSAGIVPFSMDTSDSAWVTSLWQGAMIGTASQDGLEFMNTTYPDSYDTKEFKDSLENIRLMLSEYSTADAIGGAYDPAANNFLSGNTAMMANGLWMVGDFSDETKTTSGFAEKVGFALYPEGGLFDSPMIGYFVPQSTPEKEAAAVEVIKYFTGKEGQTNALEIAGRIPASSKVTITDSIAEKYPLTAESLEISKDAQSRFFYLQSTMKINVSNAYSQFLPEYINGDISTDEFIEILTEEASK